MYDFRKKLSTRENKITKIVKIWIRQIYISRKFVYKFTSLENLCKHARFKWKMASKRDRKVAFADNVDIADKKARRNDEPKSGAIKFQRSERNCI